MWLTDAAPRRTAATAEAARAPAGSSGSPTSRAWRSADLGSGPATADSSGGVPVPSDEGWGDGHLVSAGNVSRVRSWNMPAASSPSTVVTAGTSRVRPGAVGGWCGRLLTVQLHSAGPRDGVAVLAARLS